MCGLHERRVSAPSDAITGSNETRMLTAMAFLSFESTSVPHGARGSTEARCSMSAAQIKKQSGMHIT